MSSMAYFNSDGVCIGVVQNGTTDASLWTYSGAVDEGTSPNDIVWRVFTHQVEFRQYVTLTSTKLIIGNDNADTAYLDYPDDAFVMRNGVKIVEAVGGGYNFTSSTPGYYAFDCGGRYKSNAVVVQVVNLVDLEAALIAEINSGAEAARKTITPDIFGQSYADLKLADEARAWVTGDDVAYPERYRFMIAEAARRSVSVATVRADQVSWLTTNEPSLADIEAYRKAAIADVLAASTASAKHTAAVVDWNALLP